MNTKTVVGAAIALGAGTQHTILPNRLGSDLNEQDQQTLQEALRERLYGVIPEVSLCRVWRNGKVEVGLRRLSSQRRAQVLQQVLQVLQDMELHDPKPGLDSRVRYLR